MLWRRWALFSVVVFVAVISDQIVRGAPKANSKAGGQKQQDPTDTTSGAVPSSSPPGPRSRTAWQVAINIRQGTEYKFRCGGSLISPGVVLTAAHCVHSSDIMAETTRVVVGEIDRNTVDGTEQTIGVDRIITHPNYTGTLTSLYSHDIALLRLTSHVTITDTVYPVPSLASDTPSPEFDCFMTGWGINRDGQSSSSDLSSVLTMTDIEPLPLVECNKRRHWDGLIEPYQLCGSNKRSSACLGDSGGPLVCVVNNTFVQYGVTSWGSKSCDRKPVVFTRVSYYKEWINQEAT